MVGNWWKSRKSSQEIDTKGRKEISTLHSICILIVKLVIDESDIYAFLFLQDILIYSLIVVWKRH